MREIMAKSKTELIGKFLKSKGSCTLDQIVTKFSISRASGVIYLRKIGALTSFNCDKQGKHLYILPQHYQFDHNDMLFLGEVGFFKGGNLLKAICHLVENSPAGMGARELDKILKTTTHSQLPGLFRRGLLLREKAEKRAGNAYFYFSANPQKSELQREAYFNPPEEEKKQAVEIGAGELPDVIETLLTIINHPDFSAKSVVISLKRRGKTVSRDLVDRVFSKYLLGKKNS
jgi:hypothetical protein